MFESNTRAEIRRCFVAVRGWPRCVVVRPTNALSGTRRQRLNRRVIRAPALTRRVPKNAFDGIAMDRNG